MATDTGIGTGIQVQTIDAFLGTGTDNVYRYSHRYRHCVYKYRHKVLVHAHVGAVFACLECLLCVTYKSKVLHSQKRQLNR